MNYTVTSDGGGVPSPSLSGVQVIVTSDPNGTTTMRSCPSTITSAMISKIPDPRQRIFSRRTSHTLLYVPEQRRVSTVSGVSITSCPSELSEDFDDIKIITPPQRNFVRHQILPTTSTTFLGTENSTMPAATSLSASPPDVIRRKSVQTGAPAIGFRPKKCFERRASQPTISVNLMGMNSPSGRRILELQHHQQQQQNQSMPPMPPGPRMSVAGGGMPGNLTKRVSWLSVKSLQDSVVEPLIELRKQQQQEMINASTAAAAAAAAAKTDSRTNSQIGSVLQLDDGVYDLESDTPPMDTLSWSNAGIRYGIF
uniref:Uncharacterized protein n=1 Tax=Panagrolaimus superbus TaxID=310955 RepID=A0A914Z916_9BILA